MASSARPILPQPAPPGKTGRIHSSSPSGCSAKRTIFILQILKLRPWTIRPKTLAMTPGKEQIMKKNIELQALSEELGPRFQAGAAERDSSDVFVAEHYDLLKERKVFSALIPAEIGGGGASHSAMCAFLRQLAHYCPSTALALS